MATEYEKYEFCRSVDCDELITDIKNGKEVNRCSTIMSDNCLFTAKEYHKWLKFNGYIIVKKENIERSDIDNE